MPAIITDTEGSGLFDFKRPADAEGQPRLAELAMLAISDDFLIQEEFHAYVKPDGWEMHPDATAVNGLTTEFLHSRGEPIQVVLDLFENLILNGYFVVAHNSQHDLKQIRAEYRRAGRDDLFDKTRNVCTMRKSMLLGKDGKGEKVTKLNGKGGWAGLVDLAAHFKIPPPMRRIDGTHSAFGDVRCLHPVYRAMVETGIDMTPEVHRNANHDAIRQAV